MANKIEKFKDRLSYALNFRKLKPTELAKKSNLSRGTMSHYLKGTYEPKLDKVKIFAKILNVSFEWLLGIDVPMLYVPKNFKSKNLQTCNNIDLNNTVKIPVISTVPASFSKASDFIYDEYIEYPRSLLQYSDYDKRYISLKVDGDSMYPELFDRDSILVDILLDIKNGDIGVFYLNGDFTVKRVYLKEKSIIFKPSNPDYQEKEYTHKELHEMGYHKIGKVVKIIERKL